MQKGKKAMMSIRIFILAGLLLVGARQAQGLIIGVPQAPGTPATVPACDTPVTGADVTIDSDVDTVFAANVSTCGASVQNISAEAGAVRCRFLNDAAPASDAGIKLGAGEWLTLGPEASQGLRCTRVGIVNQTLVPTVLTPE